METKISFLTESFININKDQIEIKQPLFLYDSIVADGVEYVSLIIGKDVDNPAIEIILDTDDMYRLKKAIKMSLDNYKKFSKKLGQK